MASPAEVPKTGCPNSNQMGSSDNSVHRGPAVLPPVQFHLGRFMLKNAPMMMRERGCAVAQNRLN